MKSSWLGEGWDKQRSSQEERAARAEAWDRHSRVSLVYVKWEGASRQTFHGEVGEVGVATLGPGKHGRQAGSVALPSWDAGSHQEV